MAKWPEDAPRVTFSDMPERLREADLDSPDELKEERRAWLESHGLSFADFLAWKRSQSPLAAKRPPSRRKLMTPEQLAELDARLEQEREWRW